MSQYINISECVKCDCAECHITYDGCAWVTSPTPGLGCEQSKPRLDESPAEACSVGVQESQGVVLRAGLVGGSSGSKIGRKRTTRV